MDQWPADVVQRRPLSELIPYARNPRTHTDEQVAQIAAAIRQWGWTNPILVDEQGTLIAGHGRLLAARQLGLTEAPVMVAQGWSDAQKQAYVLADNKLALNAGWDPDLLKIELAALADLNFELGLTGFSELELGDILADRTSGLTDPDEAPEPPVHPVTEEGDIWLLGRHRLMCGDSTQAEVVSALLGSVRPHLMVTDPPYGVDYDADWRNQRFREDGSPIGGRAIGKVENDDEADWRRAWDLFPGEVAYVWHADLRAKAAIESLEASGFQMRAQIVWAKGRFVIGRGHYHFQHEPCWYAVRKSSTGHWQGDRCQSTLWSIQHQKSETGHSAQKPIECMKRPIENNSSPGQAVYDPFVGSGTTIIAGEMTGRAIYAIELSPAYVDVCLQRWQNFTGNQPTRERDGRSYQDLAASRYA